MTDGKDKLGNSGTVAGGAFSSIGGAAGGMGGSSLYKSEFLKDRLLEQNEKRKRERKLKKTIGNKANA